MSAKTSTILKQNTQFRRRYMAFIRMVRYGINNFSRNAWLTTAATAVMTITLLIILTSYLSHNIFNDTISSLRQKVDISIYLKDGATPSDVQQMQTELQNQSNTESVRYISPSDAQKLYNEQNKNDLAQLQALADITKDTGPLFPGSFRIKVKDLGKLDELKSLVDHDKTFQANLNPLAPPSYGGDKQSAIDNIARTAVFAEQAGLIASIIFVIISTLIIFNTIRMAIFNRREEIQMMKLIGADKGFIRGPFIVEAIMYGFFAAIISVGLAYAAVIGAQGKLAEYGITTGPTVQMLQTYPALIILATILIGAILGIISSQMAVRRYLRV